MKVLLIEDSKLMRVATEGVLTRAGYQVVSAVDGEQGLQLASETSPTVILLDMLLPKMSGIDVLQRLKQQPATAAIPVIVLTSLSQKNEAKLMQAGAAAFFEKSEALNGPALIQAIEKVLKSKTAR